MKNILLLTFLVGATTVAVAPTATAQTSQDQPSKKEMKAKRKQRRQNGPEVYKGTVANQRRVVTDANGSEKDDDGDDTSRKANKRAKKSN